MKSALVLGLWAAFWLFALGLAAALFAVPVVQARYAHGPDASGLLAGLLGLTLLWALRPRFAAPREDGRSALTREAAPLFAALVDRIAERSGSPRADALALIDHANAFAAVDRRLLLPTKRTVGVGLPLFFLLDEAELSAVLAHEFGHHVAGDHRLGPFVYRTRRSLADAIESLDDSPFFLDVPFRLYTNLFLRASGQLSREQERAADLLSARVCGGRAAAGALRKIEHLGALWDVYFEEDVVPLVNRGARMPLRDGFLRFVANEPEWRPAVRRRVAELRARPPSPSDTHPPLAERLALLGASGDDAAPRGCVELLGGLEAAEQAWYGIATKGELRPVSWEAAGRELLIPALREALQPLRLPAPGWHTLGELPRLVAEAPSLLRNRDGVSLLSPLAEKQRDARILTHWLTVALAEAQFEVEVRPGALTRLRRGELAVCPAQVVEELASGVLDAAGYAQFATRAGEVGAGAAAS